MGYVVTRETMEHAYALKRATANMTPAVLEQIINEAIDAELTAGRLCQCENCSCGKSEPDEAPTPPDHDRHYDEEADGHDYGAAFSQ